MLDKGDGGGDRGNQKPKKNDGQSRTEENKTVFFRSPK